MISIDSISSHVIQGDLRFKNANAQWQERSSLIVKIEGQGHFGLGEAAPLPNYSADSLDEVRSALNTFEPTQIDLNNLKQSITEISQHQPPYPPSFVFAIESAYLDLASKIKKCSVASILASNPQSAKTSILYDPQQSVPQNIQRAQTLGADAIKVKISNEWDPSIVAWLEELVATSGAITIRLDANQSWSKDVLLDRLDQLKALGIEFVEEPVSASTLLSMSASPCPLAIDESLRSIRSLEDFLPLIQAGSLKFVMIKPAVVGGVLKSIEIAHWAKEHKLTPMISHLLDGPIAMATYAEVACAIGHQIPHGLGWHPGIEALGKQLPPQFDHGVMTPFGHGLGVLLGEVLDD